MNTGSIYYNYKNAFSIVFLPICDANGKYLMFDIGAPGRRSDGGVFRSCEIGKRFFAGQMNLPSPAKISENGPVLPYFIVGDEGFPLTEFLMRPYSRYGTLGMRQKVFNYRLSRARRIVECSFGILVQRFRIFRRPIIAKVETVISVVKAAACLHNFIIEKQPLDLSDAALTELQETSTSEGLIENDEENHDLIVANAIDIRKKLAHYFYYEGSVPWQWQKVRNVEY